MRHMFFHEFLNPYCKACNESKMRRIKRMRCGQAAVQRAKRENFGELVTADHLIRRDSDGAPEEGAQNALVVSDNCTSFLGVYLQGAKSKEETPRSFLRYQAYSVIQLLDCDDAIGMESDDYSN